MITLKYFFEVFRGFQGQCTIALKIMALVEPSNFHLNWWSAIFLGSANLPILLHLIHRRKVFPNRYYLAN
jgi:hypothetical protein